MKREILGKGWKFPVQVDARGRIAMSEADEDIREAIRVILFTAKGERVMQPEFGCSIHNYVFAPMNKGNLALIENSVREALEIWEPRIEVLKVKADTSAVSDGKLLISIEYEVRSTNITFNLVFPLNIWK